MTVKRLLTELDSDELTEWFAYDQRWPLPDPWGQTARLCRTVMSASGNFRHLPEEKTFIPSQVRPNQTPEEMAAELMKLSG